MCANPPSPRHAQPDWMPDWMGGGLVSRQMMHAPTSVAMSGQRQGRKGSAAQPDWMCRGLVSRAWSRAGLENRENPAYIAAARGRDENRETLIQKPGMRTLRALCVETLLTYVSLTDVDEQSRWELCTLVDPIVPNPVAQDDNRLAAQRRRSSANNTRCATQPLGPGCQ